MDIQRWSDWLSPDLTRVLRRFPLAVVFAAAATIVVIVQANRLLPLDEQDALRLFGGAVVGFILALAGSLFVENRPEARRIGAVLAYPLPLLAPVLFQIRDAEWMVLPLVPLAAVMWLSVAGFTRIGQGAERRANQDRFWWLNERAVISGVIAVAAAALFCLGLLAIDRSLDLLFGIELWDLMMQWVLPVVCCLFVPVYWLAVLPGLDAYDAQALESPDFLTQAIGFVGLFVLTPLLGIYALILAAYGVQIAVTQTLPVGVLGWLVTTFLVAGAANWLVLHPRFLQDRLLARLYRRLWFPATLLPLVLLAIGLFVRVAAYGLTPERMLLIAGGVWALVLTVFHLLPGRRGDIRLIPALAGIAFVVLSVGPFSMLALPASDQAGRFEAALTAAEAKGGPGWTPDLAQQARGALDYLTFEGGEARLVAILARHGHDADADALDYAGVVAAIGLPPDPVTAGPVSVSLTRELADPVSVAGTPLLLGEVTATQSDTGRGLVPLNVVLRGRSLVVTAEDGAQSETDLSDWYARQSGDILRDPVVDFALGNRRYRLVVNYVNAERDEASTEDELIYLGGLLFADGAD
ncbi:MAG: DUF4153 domain-containing protein [Alphaproteobacteria bacterium]|nr:DUF4153 domain-containing protein [Alphaproteobacteria bacterium]